MRCVSAYTRRTYGRFHTPARLIDIRIRWVIFRVSMNFFSAVLLRSWAITGESCLRTSPRLILSSRYSFRWVQPSLIRNVKYFRRVLLRGDLTVIIVGFFSKVTFPSLIFNSGRSFRISPSDPSWFPRTSGRRSAKAIRDSATLTLRGDVRKIRASSSLVVAPSFSIVGVASEFLILILLVRVTSFVQFR